MMRALILLLTAVQCTAWGESLAEIGARVGRDRAAAFAECRYMEQSRDYFSRFSRDENAKCGESETEITMDWRVLSRPDADPLVGLMATHLADFLRRRMGAAVDMDAGDIPPLSAHAIVLQESGGGEAGVPGSYTIEVTAANVVVRGADAFGLRDGVVRLVDRMGFRAGPFLERGSETRKPLLPLRLGFTPSDGSYRETVFLGYNAVLCGGGSLFALSRSNAIPKLATRRVDGLPEANMKQTALARAYGMKTFAFLDMRQKFPKDDPIFTAHPDLRGALTWKADGEYTLCTEHPLMQQWLEESVEGLFRSDPAMSGMVIIIGGEGFYHCFMRPFGVEKGHTNCARCEPLGAEQVVANLCNRLARAARRVTPDAEVVIWPYSAEHVWSADKTQAKLIEKLEPGVALLTEIEKDEYVEKPEGVRKHLWDYSIDLIGPGERAKAQIAACRARGISCYLKSEPESVFEAPRLPHIPCHDRWWDRAEALATCGATGAWVFPAFRGCYATSATEVNKLAWWTPNEGKERSLGMLAARIAGNAGGPKLREAWRKTSEAIPWIPELPSYYTGPYYLGPAQPMIADLDAKVPEVFEGYYLFMAEISDDEGVKKRPAYYTKPTGDVPVFMRFYRRLESLLNDAAASVDAVAALVPSRCAVTFGAENSSIQWFYRTARSEANFYESCMIRDRLRILADKPARSEDERAEANELVARWIALLKDDRENTEAALPLIADDVRLDAYFGGDHTLSHTEDMLRAKLELLDTEINGFVPSLRDRLK